MLSIIKSKFPVISKDGVLEPQHPYAAGRHEVAGDDVPQDHHVGAPRLYDGGAGGDRRGVSRAGRGGGRHGRELGGPGHSNRG